MLKRKLGIIFGTMLIFSLISYILIAAFGRKPTVRGAQQATVVTSFYPVYTITCNLTQDVEGVRVVNLTENHTGCLHDYQLTTQDMLLLETADLLVINGGDMELFITEVAGKFPGLAVIDSCVGIKLMAGGAHGHDHENGGGDFGVAVPEEGGHAGQEEEGENDAVPGEGGYVGQEEDFHGAQGSVNGHVWMDMERYRMQVHTVADGLCRAMPEHAGQIRANEETYDAAVAALCDEYAGLPEKLAGLEVVTFHDAFAYLCDSFGIEVIHGIDLDADSALSAGELAELADEMRFHGIRYLFAEKETGGIAEQIAQETGGVVVYLDPLTSGGGAPNAYLVRMRANLEMLSGISR